MLVAEGAKVLPSDKKTRYLLQNYRQLNNISEGGGQAKAGDGDAVVRRAYEESELPVPAGREPVEDTVERGKESASGEAVRDECDSTTRPTAKRQMTIRRWVDNAAQQKLDITWAEAMFRAGIAFSFLNFNTTMKLHEVYLEVATARPKVKLPSAKDIRTVMLNFIFLRIQKQVQPLTACWDVTGCTFIMDGSKDRRERPVMNFLAAGEQGAVLVATVKLDCIKGTVKRSHAIVKFIRNHHCTHSLMMSLDDSLSLTRLTEVRFGSVYMMMERLYDQRAVLKQMVEGSTVGRWKAMRWSTTKLQSKADLVFFTLRRESWWSELKKVVEVMEPLYNLLQRMDKDGTTPSNLVEYDRLMERMLGEVVLTTEQQDTVLDKSIAIKVMGMWRTGTPTERNWSSMDLVHSKRRNRLNPSTLEKLVYIHWNMQLLSGKNVKDNGYIDLWAQFFESLPEPEADDGSTLNEPVEEKDKTEEELVRERAFTKIPKGRIPKSLEHEDEEEERTDDSDLDDEMWKGNTPWSEASSEEEVDDSSDDDFELGLPPPIPCTTYDERRATVQRRRERPPATPSQCPANTARQYNI
ncbi:hypothetical protein CBR_g26005 [Chara braunii]|uniref:DUF659 domain-containing protein n=1 Tax=Chara braunii TaxID=69332 RepID=A0A388L715_CHABU|nr:hypothetical protein CBR_g26005 [Chara braunii]|eukprot:GBG78068.1 hypothetical protein CBR_g26005 [Chara braunii]